MRAIKKMELGFGLVNIPVKLYKAVESHDLTFHQYHEGCLGHVGSARICKECAAEVPFADIVKGVEIGDKVVTVSSDEFRELEDEQGTRVEIVKFVDEKEIDPIRFDSTYYLEPDKVADGYAILRQVLEESGFVGLVKLQLRQRNSLAVLRLVGNALSLTTLYWDDEIRPASELKIPGGEPNQEMVGVAHQLVASMVGKFDPEEFTDAYTERLGELVESKAVGEAASAHSPKVLEEVSDLLAALERSVQKKEVVR